MEVLLMGTGASDGIPAIFADSEVSRYAKSHGGKDVRTRSAALIDGQLKVDFGPDTFGQIRSLGLDANDWIAVVFTHSDSDHFAVMELQYALYPFTPNLFAPFAVHGNHQVCLEMCQAYPDFPFEVHETKSFEAFRIAEYEVTPISANHALDEDCHNLIFDDGSRRFLYATDTGMWKDPTWEFLQGAAPIDALVIECTDGANKPSYFGHLNLENCVRVVERLREMGTLLAGAQVVTTHHSHAGGLSQSQLEDALGPFGIEPGFDGRRITV